MLGLRAVCLLLYFGLWALEPASVRAQTAPKRGPFMLENPKHQRATIPVQVQRNLLVISAYINGHGPYNFLLDTGVSMSILTSNTLADSLGLRHGDQLRIVGAGGGDTGLLAYQSDSVRVSMPGVVAPHMSWVVLADNLLDLSGFVGTRIHGIIGSELFRSFVVTLLVEQGRIELTNPAAYRAPRGRRWASLPLSLERNKAYLTTPVQLNDTLTLPLKLVLDTGASHALSLELDSDPRLTGPTQRLATDLGRGLTGIVRGYLGRVQQLQLGRYKLRSVLTSYPDAGDVHRRVDVPRNGNVGYELLKRFTTVIDYPHQRLLLRPNNQFREAFEHDMCGIDLLATGIDYRRYVVLRVMPDSPAALAGLQVDDELLSINLLPANTYSLTELSRLMHSQDGQILLLILRRPNGTLLTTAVRLKRQI
jgi:hypothetical protein